MALSLIFDNPDFNFPRTYLRGFVGSTGMTDIIIIDEVLIINYLLIYDIQMPIRHTFYTPNSNVYSCDHIFENDACTITAGGVPIDAGAHIKTRYVPPLNGLRVQVLSSLVLDDTFLSDLPQLPGYWNPGV
jgi:hypothetical protein